jgi:hypothetical protein
MNQFHTSAQGRILKRLTGLLPLLFAAIFLLPAQESEARLYTFANEPLSGSLEVPANDSAGSGTINAIYNDETNEFIFSVEYTLDPRTTKLKGAQLVGPAAPGQVGEDQVILDVSRTSETTDRRFSGEILLTEDQEAQLLNRRWYLELDSDRYPNGELRANLQPRARELTFIVAPLTTLQETQPVSADPRQRPRGEVSATFNQVSSELTIAVTWIGLTTRPVSIDLHGPAGESADAPVLYNLDGFWNQTSGEIVRTIELTETEKNDLATGLLYVDIKTIQNPQGEIRAQLRPNITSPSAPANVIAFVNNPLDGGQEVPPVSTSGSGIINAVYNDLTNELCYTVNFELDEGNTLTGAHFHGPAPQGAEAGVQIGLNTSEVTDLGLSQLSGSVTLTEEQEEQLLNRNWYVNLHSNEFPEGEIRGQLIPRRSAYNFANLAVSTSQHTHAVSIPNGLSPRGQMNGLLNRETNELTFCFNWQELSGVPQAIYLQGPAPRGVNADPLITLAGFTPQSAGSHAQTVQLTEQQELWILDGLLYLNIVTSTNPDGELRAQLEQNASTRLITSFPFKQIALLGAHMVPAVETTGWGMFNGIYNNRINLLTYTADFQIDRNATTITAAQLRGPATTEGVGAVIAELDVRDATELGAFTISGRIPLTPTQENQLLAGLLYVQIATDLNPNGEIRGQLNVSAGEDRYELLPITVDQHTGDVELTAGAAVPNGLFDGIYDRSTNELTFCMRWQDLTSPLFAIHLHGPAGPGVDGDVQIGIGGFTTRTTGELCRTVTLTEAQEEQLLAGQWYVKLHTDTNQLGEIRGQLVRSLEILIADSDRDGLSNESEVARGLDPFDKDTDGDGFEDGVEVAINTDPLDANDPAGDRAIDADADGLPDFADPDDTTNDADADGFTDAYEVAVYTGPGNAAEKPVLADIDENGNADNVDAIIIFNVFLGNLSPSTYQMPRGDVNRDGVTDNYDAIILLNWFLGNIKTLPFPTPGA